MNERSRLSNPSIPSVGLIPLQRLYQTYDVAIALELSQMCSVADVGIFLNDRRLIQHSLYTCAVCCSASTYLTFGTKLNASNGVTIASGPQQTI